MSNATKRPGRSSSRDRLLDAAAGIVTEQGVQQLTIDAVAAAANVTKAGLIYHFKTRDDLLQALVERMMSEMDVRARVPQGPDAGSSPKAVLAQLTEETFELPDDQRQLLANVLAAVSSNPQLIGPAQALFARSYDWLAESGAQAGKAMALAAALDGIALLELLNLHRFTPQQREAMRAALDSAIRDLP